MQSLDDESFSKGQDIPFYIVLCNKQCRVWEVDQFLRRYDVTYQVKIVH